MKKFTSVFKFPCNFHSNSPQADAWRNATKESHPAYFGETLVCITDDERIFRKQPKHYTGVINQRAAGGKWEEITAQLNRNKICKEQYLGNLVAAEFKGQPRIK
jgi:hypothetical protein